MARNRNYVIKSKGDYTAFKKKHQSIKLGDIYESDIMTNNNMDELFSDTAIYSDFGFRFGVKSGVNLQKKHARGAWVVASGSTSTNLSNENKVVLNVKTNELSDFVYYGSAVKLFESSVTDIINKFPAELYFSTDYITFEGVKYYLISNEYNIDMSDKNVSPESVENKLRYFDISLYDYEILSDGEAYDFNDEDPWVVTILKNLSCQILSANSGVITKKIELKSETVLFEQKTYTIYEYYMFGNRFYIFKDESYIGDSIRPKNEHIDEFYNNASPFERFILTRDTAPVYSVKLNTPFENEYGEFYDLRTYVWPSINNYNPQLNSIGYKAYVNSFLDLCQYYDENYSDNSYRILTHEALKNLDWTFLDKNKEDDEQVGIDGTRVEVLNRIYGRQYDDIKTYIDGLTSLKNVNYSNNDGSPDYFLSDEVEKKGFDAIALGITPDNSIKTNPLYDCENKGYNSSDASLRIFKELTLNGKYLNSLKGTRAGIETILVLFGLTEDEYEINEYVVVASGSSDYGTYINPISGITYPNADDINTVNKLKDSLDFVDSEPDMLTGLPLNYVTVYQEDPESGETVVSRYAVPWFSKWTNYDGDVYFQMNGGWGRKVDKRYINLSIAPNIHYIECDELTRFYDETETVIKFASNLYELINISNDELNDYDIAYVTNLNKLNDLYNLKSKGSGELDEFSHYFILENANYSDTIGYNKDGECYGWRNISEKEYKYATKDSELTTAGRRLLYFESLEENKGGNNPHIGHGKYDDGEEYIDYLTNPFRWSLNNNNFSELTDAQIEEIRKIKFNSKRFEDNRKCWFFTDYRNFNTSLYETNLISGTTELNRIAEIGKYDESNFTHGVLSAKTSSDLDPFNPEGGAYNDEPAANSIINIKNIDIIIKLKDEEFSALFKELFIKNIAPYMYYMMPSTCICNAQIITAEGNIYKVVFYDKYQQEEPVSIQQVEFGHSAIDPRYENKD